MRDGDTTRYGGLGCRKAVANIAGEINHAFSGKEFESQANLDHALCRLDGTTNKSRLGANAVLAVSLSFARAAALQRGIPLYMLFRDLAKTEIRRLPRMTINLFSGGKHAGNQVSVQDLLIIPSSATTLEDGLAMASEVYQAALRLLVKRYNMRWLTADEGGLAPPVANTKELLDLAAESILTAGLSPGVDIHIALDLAASHFYENGRYQLDHEECDSFSMIAKLKEWIESYPLVSIEDGLAEEDWEGWSKLNTEIGSKVTLLGDDLLCTNTSRLRRAIDAKACNAMLLKLNQIGTISEALDALQMARAAGWLVTVSARSGETEDDWLADLAVGWSADQTKIGSITQSDRLSKYNRLLEIEHDLKLPVIGWPGKVEQK